MNNLNEAFRICLKETKAAAEIAEKERLAIIIKHKTINLTMVAIAVLLATIIQIAV